MSGGVHSNVVLGVWPWGFVVCLNINCSQVLGLAPTSLMLFSVQVQVTLRLLRTNCSLSRGTAARGNSGWV